MIAWHHWLNGHELEQAPGNSEGQGSLAHCSPWSCKVRHDLATEQQQRCNQWYRTDLAKLAFILLFVGGQSCACSLPDFTQNEVSCSSKMWLLAGILVLPCYSPQQRMKAELGDHWGMSG